MSYERDDYMRRQEADHAMIAMRDPLHARLQTAYRVKAEMNDLANAERHARLAAEAAVTRLVEALREAKVQVEILQERLGIKDTGAGTLSIINTALASVEPHTEGVGA